MFLTPRQLAAAELNEQIEEMRRHLQSLVARSANEDYDQDAFREAYRQLYKLFKRIDTSDVVECIYHMAFEAHLHGWDEGEVGAPEETRDLDMSGNGDLSFTLYHPGKNTPRTRAFLFQ